MAALLARLELPVVVDADALFGLEPFSRSHATVLTPHTGELARLLGRDSASVDAHRLDAAREGQSGSASSCCSRARARSCSLRAVTPSSPTPARSSLATAGTGDVLTGVVAAFLAKGLDAVTAAAAAATAHGLAAAVAPHQAGLVASDLLDELPAALG